MHPLLDRCSNFKAISFAPGPMWSFAPFAVDVVARRPTYTCPNPPFPSFLSTMYVGDPPTCVCVVHWFFRKKRRIQQKFGNGSDQISNGIPLEGTHKTLFLFRATLDDDCENTHAIRVSFYQKRKNDDALKVVLPSPERARSRRRRRPPRSRDRCPSFFVRRPLFRCRDEFDDDDDDALCSSRRERERRKGESLPRFCCRATTPFWVLLPPSRGKKAKSDENREREREREKVSSSWEEKKYGEKKCRSRGGKTIRKNAHF